MLCRFCYKNGVKDEVALNIEQVETFPQSNMKVQQYSIEK